MCIYINIYFYFFLLVNFSNFFSLRDENCRAPSGALHKSDAHPETVDI